MTKTLTVEVAPAATLEAAAAARHPARRAHGGPRTRQFVAPDTGHKVPGQGKGRQVRSHPLRTPWGDGEPPEVRLSPEPMPSRGVRAISSSSATSFGKLAIAARAASSRRLDFVGPPRAAPTRRSTVRRRRLAPSTQEALGDRLRRPTGDRLVQTGQCHVDGHGRHLVLDVVGGVDGPGEGRVLLAVEGTVEDRAPHQGQGFSRPASTSSAARATWNWSQSEVTASVSCVAVGGR